jgi:CubicO group peptidase (beta-lactamase class C family)
MVFMDLPLTDQPIPDLPITDQPIPDLPITDQLAPADRERFRPLEALVDEAIAKGAFPGATWGVVQHGQVRALGASGGFTYEAESPRVRPETMYDLASVSKVVATTAAAMLFYERGLLDLDTPLGDLLPAFVIAGGPGSGRHRVTIRMLLAHASGLPGYAPFFLKQSAARPDADALFRECLRAPLIATPGTRAEYSDIGFILLGKALELLAGESLESFCQREIFKPLGMKRTRYRPHTAERKATPPTERDEIFRCRVIQGEVHDENCWVLGGCAGHAGLFAPAGDVLRFADAVLGSLRSDRGIFRKETVQLFTARADLPPGSSRALGWDTPSDPSSSGSSFAPGSAGHLGYTGTSLWIDPNRDLGVVLLTNRTWPSRENKQILAARPRFHDMVARLCDPVYAGGLKVNKPNVPL